MTAPGRGKLVVISGPSGAGKTSVCRALKELPGVEFSVSATTRARREGERDGVDYFFLTDEEFTRRVEAGEFLEWARYNRHRYGTLRGPMDAALEAGKTFVVEIEVQGTRQLRAAKVPGIYVFIVPPDIETLRKRLLKRAANTNEEIEARLEIARRELEAADLYDHVIVNEDLDGTIRRVAELIS
ncbi:MAG: guanylate kinase [Planctomycetota bacterium]